MMSDLRNEADRIRAEQQERTIAVMAEKGHVTKDCKLDYELVFMLVMNSEKPCDGCNLDRVVCGGPPKRSRGR